MRTVVEQIGNEMVQSGLCFLQKPLVIGGMAMEYYGMRKSGVDIDLVICDEDYQLLSKRYPDKRKDLYGDLGVVIDRFEIWRSIALLDYEFLKQDSHDEGNVLMVSLDRLLLMRVCAMDVDKYRNDLMLMKQYYYDHFRNTDYLKQAETHIPSYEKYSGVVLAGRYEDT